MSCSKYTRARHALHISPDFRFESSLTILFTSSPCAQPTSYLTLLSQESLERLVSCARDNEVTGNSVSQSK